MRRINLVRTIKIPHIFSLLANTALTVIIALILFGYLQISQDNSFILLYIIIPFAYTTGIIFAIIHLTLKK